MADRIHLLVLTPERQIVDQDVLEVTAPGPYGQIGILPDHAALVTTLDTGAVTYKTSAGVSSVDITGGFAEVRDNVMTVLATTPAGD